MIYASSKSGVKVIILGFIFEKPQRTQRAQRKIKKLSTHGEAMRVRGLTEPAVNVHPLYSPGAAEAPASC